MKIFISHSSQDKELVLKFADLLTSGFHINLNDIFCTSLENTLKVGDDFIKQIKEGLHDAEVIIFFITPNYIVSKFCIMEMGAAWAYKNNIVPIIVPPLDYNVLNDTPMKTIQAIMLDEVEAVFNRLYQNALVEKNFISRLSFIQEHELLNRVDEFCKYVKRYANQNYGFNFKEANIKAITQNGDVNAARIDSFQDGVCLFCNFKANDLYPVPSNFISCVYQFAPHKDWNTAVSNGYVNFECRSKDSSVSRVIIEFKCGIEHYCFYDKVIELNDTYQKVKIPINYLSMSKNYLKDVSEICFVIRPNFVQDSVGQIEIRNLKYDDLEI